MHDPVREYQALMREDAEADLRRRKGKEEKVRDSDLEGSAEEEETSYSNTAQEEVGSRPCNGLEDKKMRERGCEENKQEGVRKRMKFFEGQKGKMERRSGQSYYKAGSPN